VVSGSLMGGTPQPELPMSSETTPGPSDERKHAVVDRMLRGELSPEAARTEQGLSASELEDWVRAYRSRERLAAEEPAGSESASTLERLGLVELLQTIQLGKQDAHVVVDHDGEQSHLWCREGEVVDARSARLAGSAAVYRLLSIASGRVNVDFAPVERARTIDASTPALLLEAARRLDECQQLRKRIGDTSAIFVGSANAYAAEARLPSAAWQMLRCFDGVSSVERVVQTSTLPDLETLTSIAILIDQAWLLPKPAPTAPQWLPLTPVQTHDPKQELSFVPLAQSLRARLSRRPMPKRLWASAAAGAAVVVASFVVGMWSVGALRTQSAGQVAASGGDWNATPEGSCPLGLAQLEEGPLFAGGERPEGALAGAQLPRMHRFCLAQLEVSVSEYEQCVNASACEPAERELGSGVASSESANDPPAVALQCNSGQAGRERYPINCVSFQQAQQYCAWRGGRLPTEGEWEYAAERANPVPAERHRGTLPIGSFPSEATPEGILDLLGNVSEWTTGRAAVQRPSDAAEPSAQRKLYAVLGGGLQSGTSRTGSRASRVYVNANARGHDVGFRCAFDD
jgi:hypothetical protein